ncbi:DNA-3-methyladenine glycosylase I [Nitrospira sp. BLG_2]|uniref:DNA-3-methyladenine glycosylase I n=1 Tax=Nitrospira sp. BLG_2 TaxID=3397507 RepID=UPI003B9A0E2A
MRKKPDIHRCPWVDLSKPDYVAYHDTEWGVPVHDDRRLFEFLILEGAQAGLSWYTVLRKRGNYRIAFDRFDPEKVAEYGERKVQELLANPGIIRNKAKILASINNARSFLKVQEAFGSFAAYIWRFVDGKPIVHQLRTLGDYPATSPESDAMSKDLRQRGFQFVGSTICYAHMQATGMVNDHTITCTRRQEILKGYGTSSARTRLR